MLAWANAAVIAACIGAIVNASPAPIAAADPVPAPEITARAVLPRVNNKILGWYSAATVGSGTIYSPWFDDADKTTYTYSSTWFRRCGVGQTCQMYTGCSNGWMVGPSSASTSCGAGGASGSLFCSNHVLYATSSASVAYSWYWCDKAPLVGSVFYAQLPLNAITITSTSASTSTRLSASTSATTSVPSSTATVDTALEASNSPSATPSPVGDSKSSNVGAIAGGVVGGVAALALICLGAFFLLRRRKNKAAATSTPSASGYAPPPGFTASPNMGYATAYQANEAKPLGVEESYGYQEQQQSAPYPHGPYDPHMSQYGAGNAPPPQASVQPHFGEPQHPPPQELPSSK